MSVIPHSHQDILEAGGLGYVATIGPGGEPQNNPVWLVWDGEYLMFSLHKQRQKFHNLRREPRIALAMSDPENPRRYLEVRGTVAAIDDDLDRSFIDSIARRFIGTESYEYDSPGAERVIVKVRPEHTSRMG